MGRARRSSRWCKWPPTGPVHPPLPPRRSDSALPNYHATWVLRKTSVSLRRFMQNVYKGKSSFFTAKRGCMGLYGHREGNRDRLYSVLRARALIFWFFSYYLPYQVRTQKRANILSVLLLLPNQILKICSCVRSKFSNCPPGVRKTCKNSEVT